ncbi:DUF302 domain-containing protein [Hyphococcus flavus]|uniref:DUF302 domain-containing protein n=1 Tax=Hyphococcus flavus TaxID=1866326 RepID=A0AAE9ZKF1_9PROT|nr:DUF302 domain-containing protein [Hyphococcus flavus]WDI32796.1 DUF302 domain-containing protein [Hyphococcus flavus]
MKLVAPILAAAAALSACATNAETLTQQPATSAMKMDKARVITHESQARFDSTVEQLQAAVDERGFKTFAVIDHAAGAASINQPLRPTTLIIFGNPNGGTPVMQAEQKMGLELPLKMLVSQGENESVAITWENMTQTFYEYGIPNHPAAEKMSAALKAIAEEAGRNSD